MPDFISHAHARAALCTLHNQPPEAVLDSIGFLAYLRVATVLLLAHDPRCKKLQTDIAPDIQVTFTQDRRELDALGKIFSVSADKVAGWSGYLGHRQAKEYVFVDWDMTPAPDEDHVKIVSSLQDSLRPLFA